MAQTNYIEYASFDYGTYPSLRVYPGQRLMGRASDGTLWVVFVKRISSVLTMAAERSVDGGITWDGYEVIAAVNHTTSSYIHGFSIVVDSSGNPHVVWTDVLSGPSRRSYLYYSTRDPSTGWSAKESVYDTTSDFYEPRQPQLALDSNDDLHLIYQRFAGVYYCKRTSGTWGTPEAAFSPNGNQWYVYGGLDIAVDSSNVIHLVSQGYGVAGAAHATVNNIIYRQKTGAGWQAEEFVTDMPNSGEHQNKGCSIMLDSSDDVYVAYAGKGHDTEAAYYNIKFRKRESGVWQAQESITDVANDQGRPSLSRDRAGSIHLIWYIVGGVYYSDGVQYRKKSGDSWAAQIEIIDASVRNQSLLWGYHPAGATPPNILALSYLLVYEYGGVYLFIGGWPAGTTQAVTDILGTTATGNGNVTYLGETAVTQHGVCWNTTGTPTTADSKTEEGVAGATGAFTSTIINLVLGTTYYVSTYVTNSFGTSYGNVVEFVAIGVPSGTTDPATSLEKTAATFNGTLDDDGGEACECGFEYGETTDYGTTTPTESKETDETFSQAITGLTPGKHYHFRTIATNSAGTSYGSDRQFFAKLKGGNLNIDQQIYQHVDRMDR